MVRGAFDDILKEAKSRLNLQKDKENGGLVLSGLKKLSVSDQFQPIFDPFNPY